MKSAFLSMILLMGVTFSFAGNGDSPCNCKIPDKVNIYAAGVASLEGGNIVKCTGDAGTCWEVVFKPGGGWTFTIFIEPPISFGNSNSQDNPPAEPTINSKEEGWVMYEWNTNVWEPKQ